MKVLNELMYTKSHEWVKKCEDESVVVGITDYAQQQLGDIVFINLPEQDDSVVASESFGDAESVKAVSDLISPVSGTVIAFNEELLESPEKINEDCYSAWLIKVSNVKDQEEMMNAEEYEAFVATL